MNTWWKSHQFKDDQMHKWKERVKISWCRTDLPTVCNIYLQHCAKTEQKVKNKFIQVYNPSTTPLRKKHNSIYNKMIIIQTIDGFRFFILPARPPPTPTPSLLWSCHTHKQIHTTCVFKVQKCALSPLRDANLPKTITVKVGVVSKFWSVHDRRMLMVLKK